MYATVLDKNGYPAVLYVGSFEIFLSPNSARNKLFVAFAVLLHGFKEFKYQEKLQERVNIVRTFGSYRILSPTKADGDSKNDNASNHTSTGHGLPDPARNEQCAKEAAQCGGKLVDLRSPFVTFLHFTDNGMHVDEQTRSPLFSWSLDVVTNHGDGTSSRGISQSVEDG